MNVFLDRVNDHMTLSAAKTKQRKTIYRVLFLEQGSDDENMTMLLSKWRGWGFWKSYLTGS